VAPAAFDAGLPRAATLVAEDDVECAVLERSEFERLQQSHPAIHVRILRNIAASIAAKLRLADMHLEVLSSRRS